MHEYLISSGRAGGAGMTRAQLRARDLPAVATGVRAISDDLLTPELYVVAQQLRRRTAAVACDWTAAALWGLPLPTVIGRDLEAIPSSLAARSDEGYDRSNGVRGRRLRLPRNHVTRSGDITLTTPARTWLDCSAFLTLGFSVAIADAILHTGLGDLSTLEAMVAWGRGRRGVRTARTALTLVDERAESPRESLLRVGLVTHGVPRPVSNLNVFDGDVWLARVDLAWPEWKVIAEYDGREHHGPEQAAADASRRNRLIEAGWIVLVFRVEDFSDMVAMTLRVLAALRARGLPG